MTIGLWLWAAAGAAFAFAILAGFAESRRQRRTSLDAHGWVPWRGLQVAALFALLVLVILAVKAG